LRHLEKSLRKLLYWIPISIAERRRAIGHYGEESNVTEEDAHESFEWAGEFMQVVKKYLTN